TTSRGENGVRTRLPSTASTRRSASGLRSSTATSAPMPHDCCTAFRNAAGVRVHGSVRRASSIANRCLLKYVQIGGDGPSRSRLDSSCGNFGEDAMAMATTYAPLPAAEHSAQLRKAVIASTVGTAIEWYDLYE